MRGIEVDILEDGSLGPGRQFAEASAWTGAGQGVADGLKLDDKGNVFAAGPGGVHVFAPDGTRLGKVGVPEKVGNVCFGEEDLYVAVLQHVRGRLAEELVLAAGPRGENVAVRALLGVARTDAAGLTLLLI